MAYPFPRRRRSCNHPPSSYRDPQKQEVNFDADESFPTDQLRRREALNSEQHVSTPNPSADPQYRHQYPCDPALKRTSALVGDRIHREKSESKSERERGRSCNDGDLDHVQRCKDDSANTITTRNHPALSEGLENIYSKGTNDHRNDPRFHVYPDTKSFAQKSAGVNVRRVDSLPSKLPEKGLPQPQRHIQGQEEVWNQPSLIKVTPSARRNLRRFPKDLGPNTPQKQVHRTKSTDSQVSRFSKNSSSSNASSVVRSLSGVKTFWGRLFHRQKTSVNKSQDRLINSLTDLRIIDALEPRPHDKRAQERENQKRYLQTKKLRDQRLAEFKRSEREQVLEKAMHGQEEWNRNVEQVSQYNLTHGSSTRNKNIKSHSSKKGDYGKPRLLRRNSLDLISGNILDVNPGVDNYEQSTNARSNHISRDESSGFRNLKSRQPPCRPPPPPFHDIKGVAQGRFDNELCKKTSSQPQLLDGQSLHKAEDAKFQKIARRSWLQSGKDVIHSQLSPLNCMFRGHGHKDINERHTARSLNSGDSDWSFKCLGSERVLNSFPILDTNAVRRDRTIRTSPSTRSMGATVQHNYIHSNRDRYRAADSTNYLVRSSSMRLPDVIRPVPASSTSLEDTPQHERHVETYRTLTSKDPRKDRYTFCESLIESLDSNRTPEASSNDPQASVAIKSSNFDSSNYKNTNLDPARIPRPPSSVYTVDYTFNADKTYTDAGNPFSDGVDLNKYQAFIANDKSASDTGEYNSEHDPSMRGPNLISQQPLLPHVKVNIEHESGNGVLDRWPPGRKPIVCHPTNSYWDLGKESPNERRTTTSNLPGLPNDTGSVRDTAFYEFYDDVLTDTTDRNRRTTDGLGYEGNITDTAKKKAPRPARPRHGV